MRVLSPREIITALITQFSEKCQLWAPKVLISLRKEKKRKIEENVQKGFLILELVKCIRSQIWPNEGFVWFFFFSFFSLFVTFPPYPDLPTISTESDHSSDHTAVKEIIPVWSVGGK